MLKYYMKLTTKITTKLKYNKIRKFHYLIVN